MMHYAAFTCDLLLNTAFVMAVTFVHLVVIDITVL